MNRIGIYQQFQINSDFGARPKKKIQVQNTTGNAAEEHWQVIAIHEQERQGTR
jgi:hypothetical protein